jgi:hypothetical protein
MRKEDFVYAKYLSKQLQSFATRVHPLPGIQDNEAKRTFIFQIVESVRRIKFVQQVALRPISEARKNPSSTYFDPVRAAILYKQAADIDEASWLVFLFVHFGKNGRSGYRLIADVYGSLGQGKTWSWARASQNVLAFRHWLDKHQQDLKASAKVHRGFGNHRKYQSLSAWKPTGTGEAFHTYTQWVIKAGGHADLFARALEQADGDPEAAFAYLYGEMVAVSSFGRTAKFDYLAMIGKLGLSSIRPDSVHFGGATGPVRGAQLLFKGTLTPQTSTKLLESLSDSLAVSLRVDKQVIEDSLCNWQKSPFSAVRFRG